MGTWLGPRCAGGPRSTSPGRLATAGPPHSCPPGPSIPKDFLTTRRMGGQKAIGGFHGPDVFVLHIQPQALMGVLWQDFKLCVDVYMEFISGSTRDIGRRIQNPLQHALKTNDKLFSGFESNFFQDPCWHTHRIYVPMNS